MARPDDRTRRTPGIPASTVIALLFAALFLPIDAYAYIDPSVGGYVFQVLAASAVFALVVIKLLWRRLINLVTAPFRRRQA